MRTAKVSARASESMTPMVTKKPAYQFQTCVESSRPKPLAMWFPQYRKEQNR